MDTEKRREFLKNSLKLGAVAGATLVAAKTLVAEEAKEKDVLVGESKKKETLYKQSESWTNYYNIAH